MAVSQTVNLGWTIESFIPEARVFVSENSILLVSNRNNQQLAEVLLNDENAVVMRSEVKINFPAEGKRIQFLA